MTDGPVEYTLATGRLRVVVNWFFIVYYHSSDVVFIEFFAKQLYLSYLIIISYVLQKLFYKNNHQSFNYCEDIGTSKHLQI